MYETKNDIRYLQLASDSDSYHEDKFILQDELGLIKIFTAQDSKPFHLQK
jgi:hypothetical protein